MEVNVCNQDSNGCIERLNYFNGQFLTEEDLKAEQEYFRKKQKLHNRYLHGCGIVFGLEVLVVKDNRILIDFGLALDCFGNEIVLCEPIEKDLPIDKSNLYVFLHYRECPSEPIPVPTTPATSSENNQTYSRIKESFDITFEANNPWSGNKSTKLRSWKFEGIDGIPLGKIKYKRGRWRIVYCFRRPHLK